MDIAGAFDNLTFDAIERSLKEHNFNSDIIRWIVYMLKHRKIIYELNGTVMKVSATRGTPQGGVLSQTLWILDKWPIERAKIQTL